ncbi:MAG: Chromate resistance protein ChrB [Thermoplasmatota archaeon]
MPWLLLSYHLPPNPSAPRVAVWRALKRMPGGYLQDGTYVVASSDDITLQLGILAHDIRNQGGEASLLYVDKVDDEAHLKERLANASKRDAKAVRPETPAPKKPNPR